MGLEPAKRGRQREGAKIDLGGKAVGKHARDVLGEAAAGDVGERLDGAGCANRFKDLADIDAGRREQGVAEGRCRAKTARASSQSSPASATTRRTSEKPLA